MVRRTASNQHDGPEPYLYRRNGGPLTLEHVTRLDCSSSEIPGESNRDILLLLSSILPNLQDLDLSDVEPSFRNAILFLFTSLSPALEKIMWKNCRGLHQCGYEFLAARRLTHLNLDGATLSVNVMTMAGPRPASELRFTRVYMFVRCRRLEHLSLKDATMMVSDTERETLSQQMLIKTARGHPNLRWFRSDLTEENVAS